MKKLIPVFLILTGCCLGYWAEAQLTRINLDPDTEFKNAKDLFQKEQFSLAYPVFKKLAASKESQRTLSGEIWLEARYYSILCGLQLNEPASASQAISFIELGSHTARIQMMSYHLGEYYYRKQEYGNAHQYYQQTNIANLSNREIADMKFHQAYGYFVMQQFDKAKPLFNAIRQLPNDPNYLDANYYYAFISFNEKKYDEALAGFEIAMNLPEYQSVIPFYITEIYYFKGDRDKAIAYGTRAIKQSGQYYDLQLHQLVGHMYYEKKDFAEALPYLEKFVSAKEKVTREDLYELSFCYYQAKNWPKSIEGFKQLGGAMDSLAQNSMYLLADTYLKTNDKPNARTAFQFCAANNSNAIQKEVSAFNYGKLSYDLGYMDPALKAFQSFVADYPKSTYQQEAKELLVNTLANTSNYKDALYLYESLLVKSDNIIRLYPRLLYGSAVELINDQQIDKADALLTKLLAAPYNTAQLTLAYFWKGEIAYRNEQLEASIDYFRNYLKNPVTNGEVNVTNARYSLGYGYLKMENYAGAKENFELITRNLTAGMTAIQQDAYLRAADCYFMNKEFAQALRMYESVINLRLPSSDYALYQKGIIAGAQNKNSEKVSLLQSLERLYPGSSLTADANLEVANTFLADENFAAAIIPLQKITVNAKAATLAPKAYLKLGIAYFNLDKNAESLESFQKLVTNYPNTDESTASIEYIRNIFIENQQPGAFIDFMKKNGRPVSTDEEDSLTYRSAMLRYEAKDMAAAKKGFADYLAKFPRGMNQIEANYFSAEINIDNKAPLAALPFYKAVADQAQNNFAERSSLQVARIYYFDLKDYAKAKTYFSQLKTIATRQENRLEAMRGLLRCQFKLEEWKEAAPNAEDLLQEKGIATDDRMMASMVVAKTHQLANEFDAASLAYKQVIAAGKSEYAAEAQYRIAEMLLADDKLAEAEKAGFEVIKKFGSYNLWVTKSYLLLGDVYSAQLDWFNAEATFRSIVENATIPELKAAARQKLDKVIEEKNKANKVEQSKTDSI